MRTASASQPAILHDEVSHSPLLSKGRVRTRNVDQADLLSRIPKPRPEIPARITPSTFLFLLIRLSKNPMPVRHRAPRASPRRLGTSLRSRRMSRPRTSGNSTPPTFPKLSWFRATSASPSAAMTAVVGAVSRLPRSSRQSRFRKNFDGCGKPRSRSGSRR